VRGIACALLLAGGASAVAQEQGAVELEVLRQAIDESRSRLSGYEREERSVLEVLEAIEHSAALLAADVERARAQADEARAALARREAEAVGVAERLATLERAMSARAAALYRAGELGALPILFSSGDLREFLSRVQTLRRLLSHDASLLVRHRNARRSLDAARELAARAAADSEQAERVLGEREAELLEEGERKRELARQLRHSRSRERRALAELETASRALEEAVAALPEQGLSAPAGTPSAPFGSLRGRLPAPVAADVARGFGRVVDSEFRTATFRKGVEFDVPVGTPVYAVADGRVRYAGRFRGYGNTVIVDHGEHYFTVSAHLSEIGVAVSDWVAAGDRLGLSGDSGSLTGAHLYFEVRRGGDAEDPSEWLPGAGRPSPRAGARPSTRSGASR
jgi:septal ring factor EnvC (AmiA/AmiB activator)